MYGLLYAACVYAGVIGFTLRGLNRLGLPVALGTLLVASAALVIVVPTAVLPKIHLDLAPDSHDGQSIAELDVSFVDKSLKTMKSSVDSTVSSIEEEKKNMTAAIEKLSAGLEHRNRQLREMNEKHRLLQQEVERYKVLAKMTETEADAVSAALQKGKYLDYFIGFILGFASSAAFAFASRLWDKGSVRATMT